MKLVVKGIAAAALGAAVAAAAEGWFADHPFRPER